MDSEYDRKFEEMKKYIPFLESMIKRLENTSSVSNPRQAQLDKIKSLRDLLMDKKKRMKMENLLKCEQVLVNLYEKVEQRDSLPGPKNMASSEKHNSDLHVARNKLKSTVSKIHNEGVETLPEIARASQIEVVCVPGSKEPALFQRRPNKSSISPLQNKIKEPSPQMHKKNYTRVLLSPEPSRSSWSTEENSSETVLFSRRSPKKSKSPRRRSPSFHKKERKKSSKNKSKQNSAKDLNITLNVPEESLNSLNTKDILSRIINCSDKDVNIDTLRELRSQILGELKETGTGDDISDLILKTYKDKSKTDSKTEEVEEGELSDSESEAIESIYGSLVIMDKEKVSTNITNQNTDEEKPRKIQICLVINSDKAKETIIKEGNNKIVPVDLSDFESVISEKLNNVDCNVSEKTAVIAENSINKSIPEHITDTTIHNKDQSEQKDNLHDFNNKKDVKISVDNKDKEGQQNSKNVEKTKCVETKEKNKIDVYTPNTVQDEDINKNSSSDIKILTKISNEDIHNEKSDIKKNVKTSIEKSDVYIPLLEPAKDVSEIDILQALKKEILCETNNVLSTDADTPLLHQPKVTKVINANEVGSKKRISIEKYKAKANTPLITVFDTEKSKESIKDDTKKQSLKLTEKECERFNFLSKLTVGESSEEEDEVKSNLSLDDIYGNLAPKSPDHDDFAETGIKPPVLIPSDPVQAPAIVSSEADIDMRKILPLLQSSNKEIDNLLSVCNEKMPIILPKDKEIKNNEIPIASLYDPRMKRDINSTAPPESSNPYLINVDKTSRVPINYANTTLTLVQNVNPSLSLNVNILNRNTMMSPSLPHNMTPNINVPNLVPNMTPSRAPSVPCMTPSARYDMTPSRQQTTDINDYNNSKHVYAPMFPVDNRDHNEIFRDIKRQPWDNSDQNNAPFWEDVDYRGNDNRLPYEQFQNCPRNDMFNFDLDHRSLDCPSTPSHSFGRLDCPATPTPSFGRMDGPITPLHHYGRSECPSTPNHSFGRSDSHIPTPFARSDFSQSVQNQSFGKQVDPRISRNSDYDNYHTRDDDRERGFFQENNFKSNSYRSDRNNRNNKSEYYRRYQREQSAGRNERSNRNYKNNKNYDNSGRNYRDSHPETSVGRYSRDIENDRSYSRNLNASNKIYDDRDKRYQRERSVSRSISHSSPRDTSTFSNDNKLSVHRQAGQSFTIDTNIGSSFQDIINSKDIEPSFVARRQRAASVGRNLGRDFSPKKQNNESKYSLNNLQNTNKRLDFRRACSVGRDIKESNLDFNDIKAELKSFRLKGESRWNKEENVKKETSRQRRAGEGIKNVDHRSRRDIYDSHTRSLIDKYKYSAKKNIRDPRLCREHKNDEYRSKSKDSKNYGIVYSNDNITKGTILGQGYGVKNYKIPKLKKPQECVENKTDSDSKTAKNNKNEEVNITTENKTSVDKKKETDNKESNLANNKVIDSKQVAKETKFEATNVTKSKVTKKELDSSDNIKLLTEKNKANILHNKKRNDSNLAQHVFNSKNQLEESDAVNVSIDDSIEKRVTRSASRTLSKDSSLEISPIKRLKRGKKLYVYETDSDDNDKNVEKTTTIDLSPTTNKNIKIEISGKAIKEKDISEKEEVLTKITKKPPDNKSTCGIDTSFGIGDLEMFSDNIPSDPVTENINDLIADLDHDLDSSKTVDNNKFTRELSLEKMLENITSPESNETSQDLPVELLISHEQETERKEEEELKSVTDTKLTSSKEKIETKLDEVCKNTTLEGTKNNIILNLKTQNNAPTETINKSLEVLSDNIIPIENQDKLENLNPEDIRNNDAVVTTSDDEERLKVEPQLIEAPDDNKGNIQTTPDSIRPDPDSTINSNICTMEAQRNLPDSTNDLSSEMNSVISSTHVDITPKDSAETSPFHTPASNDIESIGKLLSILQDKSKIKELLVLLGNQSSENEKIKKKLEKLSEIVSDDEESSHAEKVDANLKDQKLNEIQNLSKDLIQEDIQENEINEENITRESLNQNLEESKSKSDGNQANSSNESNQKENLLELNEASKEDENISMTSSKETSNLNEKEDITTQCEEVKENNDHESSNYKEINVTSKKKTSKILTKIHRKKSTNKVPIEERRLTRSDAANRRFDKPVLKKPSRELQKLQEDIREMFIRDDILSATGIRMCRLAKFADETKSQKDESLNNESKNQEPVVVLQKCNDLTGSEDSTTTDKIIKKKTVKGKKKVVKDLITKSKLKQTDAIDPYEFETDSLNETINTSNEKNISSESESDSLASSKSYGSTEILGEIKKKKRKRTKGWQAGIIKPKNKKKKVEEKTDVALLSNNSVETQSKNVKIPDANCYTDKTYYFDKNQSTYECRLCSYNGPDIVSHYKKQHSHSEIPLSRMNPLIAMEAIKESEKINFQVICKLSSKRYICRFCSKEFGRKKPVLESFFWHVVSMHTGEYKQLCSECLNVTRCPFSLDIPPPPKDKGQLLGYVCEKCNYTQISLENLKSHVILRHNDEQTAVYTINLSVTTKSIMNNLITESEEVQNTNIEYQLPRILRSSRSNLSIEEINDVRSDCTDEYNKKLKNINSLEKEVISENEKVIKTSKIQSKITFENDNTDELLNFDEPTRIKIEPQLNEDDYNCDNLHFEIEQQTVEFDMPCREKSEQLNISSDIFAYPHFKIKYSESGFKEYICCINGIDLHYRTTLLISLKKHVQLKHSENWDGYCFICKVIVMPQGKHLFKDCLQHFLDQHMDDFPIVEEKCHQICQTNADFDFANKSSIKMSEQTKYINVRPLSQLISQSTNPQQPDEGIPTLPVIESVVSLGAGIEQPQPSPCKITEVLKVNRYEEAQARIMSKKHRFVLGAMMTHVKLAQIFKCAGRFCSFTTNVAEDALTHASTHIEIGGENSLRCVYCDFDSSGNAIDLITHVFKDHGCCQYVCGLCFYRAAASQLVNAHITRVHGSSANVTILHTAFQTASVKEDNILSREAAVPYYLCCASSGSDETCKFRTYTPGKFCEHLQIRHSSLTEHSCFMCSASLKTAAGLIRHLKTHGLKLYQCTWCVFGADNETELLAHASANHPDKLPKAYLRIITNKEGTSELRVLPLAHLNKSDIPVVEITSNIKDNPVREAERSIELEKLIGHTTLMVESITAIPETNTAEKESTSSEVSQNINEPSGKQRLLEKEVLEQPRLKMDTSPPQADGMDRVANQSTPIIDVKSEIIETPEKASEVVLCLDSEEEDSRQNVIDLSEDQCASNTEKSMEPKLLPLTELYVCAKCNLILKSPAGFKKHITSCFSRIPDPIPCAHCPLKMKKRYILTHYTKTHGQKSEIYICKKCPSKFATLAAVKEHDKNDHSILYNQLRVDRPAVISDDKPAVRNRRKRSLIAKDKVIEPPEKMKRYGPRDVNLLPINPILDESVFCSLCEFSTKVRLNMVRHLQLHAKQQPVPQTAPVNPVPHLETNEKHFDKMVNLASSSLVFRALDRNKNDSNTTTSSLMIPPEATSRYPKYIPEKHRHTCGAKGCSYISVDESMLKCHWETLHSGTSDFRCVHCPAHQQLDTSKPLTAGRIIGHLKMHDVTLYACSLCSYYHYKRNILENHLIDAHKGGQVMVVREEGSPTPATTNQVQIIAPTMDLKPWQCGVCKFKSLLRPEVIEHCAKIHNSKMQYKCAYCAFRTSNSENIIKHQSKSHSDKKAEIFHYYYREGSVLDDADGTPLWQKQSKICDLSESKIKSESPCNTPQSPQISRPVAQSSNNEVDLNLVKQEVLDSVEETIESLCKDFGEFCEPNGLKYKCSLCKNVVEDTVEAMKSHLYEELKYRKWGCSICSYKAFHKAGLNVHMQTEHRQNKDPIALQLNVRVETWVAKLLEYQTELIKQNKDNLAKQKEEILRIIPGSSRSKSPPKKAPVTSQTSQTGSTDSSSNSSSKPTMVELERLFGSLGTSVSMSFCCPKCHLVIKDEDVMQNHLEYELNKIRWLCSNCSVTFQNYHEAQFHCRSVHIGQSARPIEATRDSAIRSAWVKAVVHIQKLSMNYVPVSLKTFGKDVEKAETESNAPENSLLVVRYEERVPTPEEQMARRTPTLVKDYEEDKAFTDDSTERHKIKMTGCPHCEYKTINARVLREHILRHYNLKPTSCGYCGLSGSKKSLEQHQKSAHSNQSVNLICTAIPSESPLDFLQKQSNTLPDITKLICLVCRHAFTDTEASSHHHEKIPTSFGKKGSVVVKCNICFNLCSDANAYFNHHKNSHPTTAVDYVFCKLNTIANESKSKLYACSLCDVKFSQLKDIKIHSDSNHSSQLKYTIVPKNPDSLLSVNDVEYNETGTKRPNIDTTISSSSKKVARKSTTKLPFNKSSARKSTTKLPLNVPEEFSYYGTEPSTKGLENVTALMSFCNTMVPFTLKKLNEIIKINPIVLVDKLNMK